MTSISIDLFLAINQDGEFFVSTEDAGQAVTELESNYVNEAVRTLKLTLTIDLPTIEEIPVAVPAEQKAPAQVDVVT